MEGGGQGHHARRRGGRIRPGRSGDLPARTEVHFGGAQAHPQALSVYLGADDGRLRREEGGTAIVALETPACAIGWEAKDFTLEDAYGDSYRFVRSEGTVRRAGHVHPQPLSLRARDRRPHCARDALDLQKRGVGVIAVMPNDYVRYPGSLSRHAPEQMKRFAEQHDFSFPYIIDETQAVARTYRAVCTPDFRRLRRRAGTAVLRPARCVANHARPQC